MRNLQNQPGPQTWTWQKAGNPRAANPDIPKSENSRNPISAKRANPLTTFSRIWRFPNNCGCAWLARRSEHTLSKTKHRPKPGSVSMGAPRVNGNHGVVVHFFYDILLLKLSVELWLPPSFPPHADATCRWKFVQACMLPGGAHRAACVPRPLKGRLSGHL